MYNGKTNNGQKWPPISRAKAITAYTGLNKGQMNQNQVLEGGWGVAVDW